MLSRARVSKERDEVNCAPLPVVSGARLLMFHLTNHGRRVTESAIRDATIITAQTLVPPTKHDQGVRLKLLKQLC